ncbi:MAG: hypothetical protein M5U22_00810 [Thermoleophilia bacterium]|nr:hypothetical protein [Thermoleophilia bacterium]
MREGGFARAIGRRSAGAGVMLLMAAALVVGLTGQAVAAGPATITLLPPTPGPEATVEVSNPLIKVEFDDPGAALNPSSLLMYVDGKRVKPIFTYYLAGYLWDDEWGVWVPVYDWTCGTAVYQAQNLAAGTHAVSVSIMNYSGKRSSYSWSFNVTLGPQLSSPTPTPMTTVNTQTPLVSVRVTAAEPLAVATLEIDGTLVGVTYDPVSKLLGYTPSTRLANGVYHTARAAVTDANGLSTELTWSWQVQIFASMTSSGYDPCSDCHAGFPVPNHPMANCDGCHGDGGPVGRILPANEYELTDPPHEPEYILGFECMACHETRYAPVVPMHRSAPDTYHVSQQVGCVQAECHDAILTIEHNRSDGERTPLSCLGCHQSGVAAVQAAIAAGDTDCMSCHGGDTSGSHATAHEPDTAVTLTYAACAGTACHDLNLMTEHVTVRARSCGTCHDSLDATVQAAIVAGSGAGPQQGCTVCHGAGAGQHMAQHELLNPTVPDCALCHSSNLVTEHTINHTSDCNTCHASADATVRAVIDEYRSSGPSGALNPECVDCHTTGSIHSGVASSHTVTEPTDCQGCHLMLLPDEHARPSSSSAAAGCANCHPLPGGFTWNSRCSDCHVSGGLAPVKHGAVESKHQSAQGSCAISGCHDADLRIVHEAEGCDVCHDTGQVPVSTDCVDCHGADPHGDLTSIHTAVESGSLTWANSGATATCTQCHYLSLLTEHAKASSSSAAAGCGACHPTKVGAINRPWTKRCDACHTSKHADYDTAHRPVGVDCEQCHSLNPDVRDHPTCSNVAPGQVFATGSCHAGPATIPPTVWCRTCHPGE